MEEMKRLLSAKEAAVYLGLSHRTLWAWAQQGIINCVRLRRRVLFDRLSLDKIIQQSTVGPPDDGDENLGED